jgi:hypothetical protein
MQTARLFRLREGIPALRASDTAEQPVYQRLDAGTVVAVSGDLRKSGLIDVASGRTRYTVFAEDLLARSEPVVAVHAGAAPGEMLHRSPLS